MKIKHQVVSLFPLEVTVSKWDAQNYSNDLHQEENEKHQKDRAKGVTGWALRTWPKPLISRLLGLVFVFPFDLSHCGQDFFSPAVNYIQTDTG